MFGLGPTELMIVLAIIVLLFGARKIPELMSGMGKGVKEFKKGIADAEKEPTSSNKIEEKKEEKDA